MPSSTTLELRPSTSPLPTLISGMNIYRGLNKKMVETHQPRGERGGCHLRQAVGSFNCRRFTCCCCCQPPLVAVDIGCSRRVFVVLLESRYLALCWVILPGLHLATCLSLSTPHHIHKGNGRPQLRGASCRSRIKLLQLQQLLWSRGGISFKTTISILSFS